jgi:hypothetical protein
LLLLILSLSIPEKISEIGYYQFQAPTWVPYHTLFH